ncbi:MAG: arginine repressor [Lachnospiraceae bacterium]|nr:arginine repressor [Lachnospiraceae bacterium]
MKNKRHQRIIELIEQFDIETQEDLVKKLLEDGFNITQATVSRDIRELKITKIPNGKGKQKYVVLSNDVEQLADKYIRIIRDGLVDMDTAQNILVVKTVSGMAMAVAAALDAMHLPEVVGSIAGDDTIMVAVRTTQDAILVKEKISEMI